MICEKCKSKHDGLYGSGRFCSNICARSSSTLNDNKKERKVSRCIKCGVEININKRASHSIAKCNKCKPPVRLKRILIKNVEDYFKENSITTRYRIKELIKKHKLLTIKCHNCGCGEIWNNKHLSLQLEHINGIYNDNRLENLTLLCPNCHSQTATYAGKGKNKKIKRVSDNILLAALKREPNIRQALLSVGFNSNGSANYKRCNILLNRSVV